MSVSSLPARDLPAPLLHEHGREGACTAWTDQYLPRWCYGSSPCRQHPVVWKALVLLLAACFLKLGSQRLSHRHGYPCWRSPERSLSVSCQNRISPFNCQSSVIIRGASVMRLRHLASLSPICIRNTQPYSLVIRFSRLLWSLVRIAVLPVPESR